jgi:3-oxoacyl-[acyl-carrier-protein] synthase-1/3-oxoacyl-[acyl-carrier-protein] synthase II
MKPVAVLASAALSALGRGARATLVGAAGETPRTAVRADPAGALARIEASLFAESSSERAESLLGCVARDLAAELDRSAPNFRAQRIGAFIGTSAGAMHSMQAAFAAREQAGSIDASLAADANYFSPLRALARELGVGADGMKCVQVLGACASSTLAIGLACRALEAGDCDLAIAGGYDALSEFVIAGFSALGALSRDVPRPFRRERDGLALGEGAALLALVRASELEAPAPRIWGFGASADAVHVTAPDREGRGLAAAARAALLDAGLEPNAVGLVSAHGTATLYNDSAEAKALASVFGEQRFVLHPFKAVIGHTLGAAGALESLAAWDAMSRSVLPASVAGGAIEPEFSGELLSANRSGSADAALKLSAAFGGLNAALVLAAPHAVARGAARDLVDVELSALGEWVTAGDPELVARLAPRAIELASRADSLSELVLAAVARLVTLRSEPLPPSCALIVGSGVATIEANERFDQRRRAGLAVLPRAFPPTSPNLCAGVASIAFGLRGPAFTVGASRAGAAEEAFRVARSLVAAGDVEAALVVVAEDAGPVVRDLLAASGCDAPRRGARAALLLPGVRKGSVGREPPQNPAAEWALQALSWPP